MEITPFLLLHFFDWRRSTLLLRIPGPQLARFSLSMLFPAPGFKRICVVAPSCFV